MDFDDQQPPSPRPDAEPPAEPEASEEAGIGGKKESKTQRSLDLLYNPEKADHDKSLWQFFINHVANFPTVDDLAKEREAAGAPVVMEEIQLEWYDRLLQKYRGLLQMVFEEPVELAALGRRLARFQQTNSHTVEAWRQIWIDKYKSDFVTSAPEQPAGSRLEDRRAEAARKRKEAQEKRRQAAPG